MSVLLATAPVSDSGRSRSEAGAESLTPAQKSARRYDHLLDILDEEHVEKVDQFHERHAKMDIQYCPVCRSKPGDS